MRVQSLIVFVTLMCLGSFVSAQLPVNDSCHNATPITIPASGSICFNGSNLNSTNDGSSNACNPGGGNQVWYTYTAQGPNNTVTIQPTGANPMTNVVVTISSQGCGSGFFDACDNSNPPNGNASVTWGYTPGQQVWVQVTSNGNDGDFQLCISSLPQPPSPAKTCASAVPVCDKSSFSVATVPTGSDGTWPSCFLGTVNRMVYYTFTVGQTGTLEFTGTPQGGAEFDWVLYDITNGCNNATEISCNYNFENANGSPFGMGPASCVTCPTSAIGGACGEFCPSVTVMAGNTYAILIDNYSGNNVGFDFQWGGTFQMAPTANFTVNSNVACGSSTINITNTSVAANTYSWNFGNGNTSTAQNPPAQTYTTTGTYLISLVVTSTAGCTDVHSEPIQAFGFPTIAIDSFNNATCDGFTDGNAYASATGGTPNYNFAWNTSPPQGSAAATNIGAGNYQVIVSDANGCTDTANVTITDYPPTPAAIDSFHNPGCGGAATGDAYASGGVSYSWNTSPVQNTAVATGLTAGNYTVTVTDNNGCTGTASVTLTNPTALSLSINSNTATCGLNNGQAWVTATGGSGSYNYAWNTNPVQNTDTAFNIGAGTYQVVVTDGSGCIDSISVTIGNVPGPNIAIDSTQNVSCNGATDGAGFASATGGTPNYNFAWNSAPPQFTAAATGLPAGTFQVIVTDQNSCADTTSITITQPNALSVVIDSFNNVSCNGAGDGAAFASSTGGSNPKVFSWNTSPPQSGTSASSLPGGTFQVNVVDNNGCQDSATVTITDPAPVNAVIDSFHDASCFGGSDGDAYASGGVSYSWNTSPVQTSNPATGLPAGNFTVTVTDGNGCTGTANVTISTPPAMTLTTDSIDATCNNADGQIWVTAGGGTPGYTYSWGTMPVQTGDTAFNLFSGAYTAYVTDNNGCLDSVVGSINDQSGPTAVLDSSTDVTCPGGANGAAYASATGGLGPYSFSWNTNPVQTGPTATGLPGGNYTVTVQDQNLCNSSVNVTINEPNPLVITIDSSNDVTCNGLSDGNAYSSTTGGTSPYSFAWNTSPPQNTANATGMPGGTFDVIVTDSNGCMDTASVTITDPPPVNAAIDSFTNVTCFGANDGVAYASGGISYSWNTSPVQTNNTATNLPPGNYQVTVTDAQGCSGNANVTITSPTQLTVAADSSDATCNQTNGQAWVTASGGTPGYTYSWNTSPVQTTDTAFNLPAGVVVATVTDSNGCFVNTSISIFDAGNPTVVVDSFDDVTCFGASNGIAYASSSGGTGPYNYSWNSSPVQTTATATNLPGGSYTVTISDQNSCTAISNVTITEPPAMNTSIDSSFNVTCNGLTDGSAYSSTFGGITPYTYSWNTSPVQTTAAATNLGAGSYVITATDSNGCTSTDTAIITAPNAINIVPGFVDETCSASNGQGWVTVTGGTPNYFISWNTNPFQTGDTAFNVTAGTYTAVVTDASSCQDSVSITITDFAGPTASIDSSQDITCFGDGDGIAYGSHVGGTNPVVYSWSVNPPQSTATATNLNPGLIVLTLTDSNNCIDTAQVLISQPLLLTATIDSFTNVTCFGAGDATATASTTGGTLPLNRVWNVNPPQVGPFATNLDTGMVVFSATDANGCIAMDTITITEPTPLVTTTGSTASACDDSTGSAWVVVSGSTPPYYYTWATTPQQTSDTATGLPPGNYEIMTQDSAGCTNIDTVNVAALGAPTATIDDSRDPLCVGSITGFAVAGASGIPPYTYSWNTNPVQTGDTAFSLPAGTYTVTVTDSGGCSDSVSITLTDPLPLNTTVTGTDPTCFGGSDGAASATTTNGTPPFSYSWNTNPIQTGQSITGLSAGTWMVTLFDSNNCADTSTFTLTEPTQLIVDITTTDITCFGDDDGTATVSASGGTPGYFFTWNTNPVSNDSTITDLRPGTYTVTVFDANQCSDSASGTINDGIQVTADFTSNPTIPANLILPNGRVDFTNTSQNATSYEWDFGDGNTSTSTDPSHDYVTEGSFCVQLIAMNGVCMDTAEQCQINVQQIDLIIPNTITPNGDDVNDVFEVVGLENYPNSRIQIFNRWGNKVFETDNYLNDWGGVHWKSGDPLPDGGYIFILEVSDDREPINGNVVIFR